MEYEALKTKTNEKEPCTTTRVYRPKKCPPFEATKFVDQVLQEIGWTTGLHMPVSNDENKQLEAELERLFHARVTATNKLTQLKSRREELENHIKHIDHERRETDAFLTTQKTNLANEIQQQRITTLEISKLNQDITNYDKQTSEIQERQAQLQNNLCRTIARLEELKKTVSYDSDTLRLWEDALLRLEEDNSIIRKFSLQDQNRARELELQREKLQTELIDRQQTMAKIVSEIMNLETSLNRTQKLYMDAKKERGNLLDQWRETVAHLRQRHRDMHSINLEIDKIREDIVKKAEELDEKRTFYMNEVNNNKEMQKQIKDLNKATTKNREELRNLVTKVSDFERELSIMKRELTTATNNLENTRARTKQLTSDIAEKHNRLDQAQKTNYNLNVKLTSLKEKALTVNERSKELESMLTNNEKLVGHLRSEIAKLETTFFRSTQLLKELKEIENSHIIEIRNLKATTETLEKEEKSIDVKVQQCKEEIYNFEFQIAQLEMKVEEIEETRKYLFCFEKEGKIKELTVICQEKNELSNMLAKQMVQIQNDIRRLGNQILTEASELSKLQSAIQDLAKMVEGSKRVVKSTQMSSQEKQVEENILKLKVKQAEKILDNIGDCIYTLEKHRLEMEAAMKERQLEIGVQKDMLSMKKRNLLEDKSKIKTELKERLLKIDQYKKRFELATSLLGVDEEGNPLTAAYLKIKFAQEKALLQKEGDDWDLKVKRAEQEIVAMENTLTVINATNNKFRESLNTVDNKDPEEEQLNELKKEYSCLLKKLRIFRDRKTEAEKNVEAVKQLTEESLEKIDQIKQKQINLEKDISETQKGIDCQQERLKRAKRVLAKLMATSRKDQRNVHFEQEIRIREMTMVNQNALNQVLELSFRNFEVYPTIERLCDYYRISMPSVEKYKPVPKTLSRVSVLSNSVGQEAKSSKIHIHTKLSDVMKGTTDIKFNESWEEPSRSLISSVISSIDEYGGETSQQN